MPKYKYKGADFTLQEVVEAAEKRNLTLDDYIKQFGIEVIEDDSFQTGPVMETAVAGPMTETQQQAVDTVSVLEDTSLELPEVDAFASLPTSPETEVEDIEVEEVIKPEPVEDMSFAEKLFAVDLKKGSAALGEAIASIPETIYNIFSIPQNFLAEFAGIGEEVSAEKFKKQLGIENTIADYYIEEQEKLGKIQDIYNDANYDSTGIYDNFSKGNVADGFKLMASGLAESAPISLSIMAGGAAGLSAAQLAGATTVGLAGPEIRAQREEKPKQSEIENIFKGFSLAAAESVFESIGTGTIGKVYGDILKNYGAKEGNKVFKDGLVAMYGEAFKKAGAPIGAAGEGVEEAATQITQNMINGVDPFQGVTDAFIQGVGGGTLYGSPRNIAQAAGGIKEIAAIKRINKEVKNQNQENLVKAFDKEFGTTTAQIKISQIPRAGQILDQEVDKQVDSGEITKEKGDEIKLNFRETQGTVNRLKPLDIVDANLDETVDLVKEKTELQQKIKQVDEAALTEAESERVKEIDARLRELVFKPKIEKVAKGVETTIEKLEGKAPEVFETTDDYLKAIAEDQGINLQEARTKAEGTEGVFAGKGKIFIDKEQAVKVGNIGVAAHELLHPILNALVGDVNQQEKIVNDFEKLLSKSQQAKMNELLDPYKNKETGVLDAKVKASEYLTVFSNAIVNGDIKYNENVFTKIGDYIQSLLVKLGFENANFETGRGVYNFLKEYNKTIQKETGLSERALELIKKREAETGVKVAEVDILDIPQFSRTDLKSEIDTFVQEDGAKKYDTKAEFQMSDDFTDAYTKIADTNLLDGSILSEINKDNDLSGKSNDVKAEIIRKTKEDISMRFIKNFDPAKNESLFGWMLGKNGALGFALLDVKKDYAKTARETSLDVPAGERGFVGDIAVEPTTEEAIDEAIKLTRAEAKLIDPVDIITDKATRDKYRETVQSKIENLTDKQLSFKNLKDLAPEITAEVFGVPVKKVVDPTANLSKGDATNAQMFITKNADKLIKLLPEGAVLEAATEKLIGTSTGVPKKLLDAFYDKQERVTKGAGLFPYKKKPNITKEDFLVAFGIVEGKKAPDFSPRSAEAQATKGLMSLFGRLMTNTTVRKELAKTPGTETIRQDIAAGKSRLQFSRSRTDQPLFEKYNIEKYDLNTDEGKQEYLNDIENILIPTYGRILKPGQLYGLGKGQNDKSFTAEIKKVLKEKTKDLPKKFEGFSFGLLKPSQFIGRNTDEILKNIKNQKILEANKKHVGLWTDFWQKTNDLLEKNPEAIKPVMQFLSTATNDVTHINRIGAEFVGFDNDFNTKTAGKFEHAVPNVLSYMLLIDSILDPNLNFQDQFINIKDNYKLIALSGKNNKKVDSTFRDTMPDNWKKWYDRYFNKEVAKKDGGINPQDINYIESNNVDNLETFAQKFDLTNDGVKKTFQASKTAKEKILDTQFNNILENKTGIAAEKEYSKAKAEVVGANKGRFNWFIPPTAEDFVGLLYQFLGKGKLGDKQMAWFKVNLLDPYARAMSKVSRDRVSTARNYRALKKELDIVPKDLKKKIPGEDFTVEQAVRVYIWHKQGYEIPGLSQQDNKELRDYVNSKPELKEFGDKLILLNKGFDYAKPKAGWLAGTITTDMLETLNTTKRAEYLKEWQNNVDVIFSEKNLNKIEAAYGPKFRYALENVLTRMKTGRNRTYGTDSLTGRVVDWLTNSIGAIMFFNTRSAILQTISAVNFINFSDNNPLAATKALSNQKQYWSDFLKLFNSDFLVDRRDGLRLNVNESDIADMAKKNGARGVISEILKAGFLPTQLADSFAIASGGATFYRNRLNRYLKEGVDPKKAEEMAFTEFREIAEESQQSSRPDRISAQQAGPLGRIILAFANTPAQYARLMKKAVSDLKNNRGDAKTNISKLIYYGIAQNLLFNAMQQALFGLMFGDEEEDEKKEKRVINIANSMADSILRGMGISGAIVSVLKNTVKKLIERTDKRQPDYAENAIAELLKISPPVGSKVSKVKNALRSYEWDKDQMYEKGLALDNPAYLAAGNIISAATNVPLDRAVKKVTNVKNAMDEDLQLWQRIALLGGWQDWEIGAKEEEKEKQKRKKSKFKTTTFKTTKFK